MIPSNKVTTKTIKPLTIIQPVYCTFYNSLFPVRKILVTVMGEILRTFTFFGNFTEIAPVMYKSTKKNFFQQGEGGGGDFINIALI